MQKASKKRKLRPAQHQVRPGSEKKMHPQPVTDPAVLKRTGRLSGKSLLITGGDSGIGRAVALLFAKEGADIAISYLKEHADAKETAQLIQDRYNRKCLLLPGDISREQHCKQLVRKTAAAFGKIDILVNNAAIQFEEKDPTRINSKQLLKTFATNIFSFFWITREALSHMKRGSCIINTSSVTAYRGSGSLLSYSATKGAVVTFTRSLSASLVKAGIRVNGVAPGPVWTPLIVSGYKGKKVAQHGSDVPLARSGEPAEIAPAYLFLATDDGQYMTGQFLHPNGGEIING